MRGKLCRALRLELVAGLGVALAIPALASAAGITQALTTQTSMSVETHDRNGRTEAAVTIKVLGADGQPVTGAVSLADHGNALAGVALDAMGQATTTLDLAGGEHQLSATYLGDTTHTSSISSGLPVKAMDGGTFNFTTAVSPTTLSLTAGQSGTLNFSVTPVNAASLSTSRFILLSCSGLPDQATCSFNPSTLEVPAGSTAALTSSLAVQTQASNTTAQMRQPGGNGTPIAWAFLLPGVFVLGGIAWGTRRRTWLSRVSLVAMLGLVTVLGTAGCNPRYNYLNHGPIANPGTPAGTYTISVDAQSSNGVTAISNSSATFVLTVK